MSDDAPASRPRSRFWLFAPFTIVGLVIVAWCVAWFVIKDRTVDGLDAWLAREAAAGRQWTCADRGIGGFPFRIELDCASVSLRQGALTAQAGALQAVAQIYRPRHVIARLNGPLQVTEGGLATQVRWRQLESSVRSSREGLQQLALIMDGGEMQVSGATPEPIRAAAERLEVYARPSPSQTDESVDVVARAAGAAVPALDAFLGTPEPANLELQARATHGLRLGGQSLPQEVERWREAGGALDVVLLKLAKGNGRFEARGRLGLDEERRVQGRLEGAAQGLEAVLRRFMGEGRAGLAAGLLGALAGRREPPRQAESGPGLQPLPPLRFENGRVLLGPLPIPGLRLPPLY
ncbi:DUF2125 domain-containing protein [Salinarimonas soli]|nr:DUF2125 domain-containing protein [Salinarimonas soli]